MRSGGNFESVRLPIGGRDRARPAAPHGGGRRCRAPVVWACLSLLTLAAPARADDWYYDPKSTYGDVGILDMPSARMAPDGELSATASIMNGTQRYNFSFELLPWFEGSFRYSRIDKILGGAPLFDRSFGMKLRLLQESEDLPEVSLGIRDILGTGVYGSEYFVASKRFGDFDVTAGLGWGRLATVDAFPNPFGLVIPSFKTRRTDFGSGGTISFGQFFHGPGMGLFGGVVWRTPVEDLNVLLEYSSDRYPSEVAHGAVKIRMPVNVGVSYKFFDLATVSAAWLYGSSYGITLTMSADPTVPVTPQKIGPEIPAPFVRPPQAQADALTTLLARGGPRAAANTPWVHLPAPGFDRETLSLKSALISLGSNVEDVEITGHTLLIDARIAMPAATQCARYAQIVAPVAPRLETIALSDPDDTSGLVSFCKVAHAKGAAGDAEARAEDAALVETETMPGDPAAVERKIRTDIAAQSLRIEALSVEPQMVWLYFANYHYGSQAEAAGRIARVLMADAPPSVEIFHIVSVQDGLASRDFQVARSALERATTVYATARELGEAVAIAPAPLANPVLDKAFDESYPRLHWNIGPGFRQGFFDPDQPLEIQILGAVDASIDLTPNLTFETRLEGNIYDNYNLARNSNSQLPHVRSDLNLYLKHGINGIANLDALYKTRLSRDVYFEAKAGYLEDMFAGGGMQVLWRPDGERFAFGADLYEVWQRDFDRLFGLRNYHILTGHVSAYYETPWYGLNVAVHAGRYLAGDYGATFEVTRRFSTGVEIGAFATFTNVPFAKFGEGSFDKGIIVHIPLEWALPFYSKGVYDLHIRSLIRDGGQRLFGDDSLYEDTLADSYGEIQGHLDDVTAP